MSEKLVIDKSTLTDIADSIRAKSGSSDLILVSALASAIDSIPSGGSNGLFFDEFVAATTTNLNGTVYDIDLQCDDVDWLIMFPMQADLTTQYAWNGCIYIPNVFGNGNRTSYGVTNSSTVGCQSGSNVTVGDAVLSIKHGQNCYLPANVTYGIVYKQKEN